MEGGLEVDIVEKRVGRERLRMRMLLRWGRGKGKGGRRIMWVFQVLNFS